MSFSKVALIVLIGISVQLIPYHKDLVDVAAPETEEGQYFYSFERTRYYLFREDVDVFHRYDWGEGRLSDFDANRVCENKDYATYKRLEENGA